MTQPREHCGELSASLGLNGAIPGGECVLRPGHSGSHADENGMRWWLATPPAPSDLRDRYAAAIASYDHAVGQATDPAPRDHHYGQADAALAVRDRELERMRVQVDYQTGRAVTVEEYAAEQRTLAEDAERRLANLQSSYATLAEMASSYSQRAIDNGERAEQAEDLLRVAHDTSNRSEAERARAVRCSQAAEAAIARVRAECDRIEAAVRANPTAPDFDGAYLAAIGHIRRTLNPQKGICRRCHCPADTPDCKHCNCCDVPDPTA